MSVPRYLIVEWPVLGTYFYLTVNHERSWLFRWVEKETYHYGHVAYLTNQEPASHAKFRG